MGGKIGVRHYFIEGLTARGYISLLPILMTDWRPLYIVGGGPGSGKSTFIKSIGLELLDRGYEVDFFRSALDPDALAGFVIPGMGLCMLNQLEVKPIHWRAPGIIERFVDLSPLADEGKIKQFRKEIIDISKRLVVLQNQVEKDLIMTYSAAQDKPWRKKSYPYSLNDDLFEQGVDGLSWQGESAGPWPQVKNIVKKLQKGKITPCFLHGINPGGWVNLAPHFLADCDQIRLEGEDKLDALNWVLNEAQQLGQVMNIVLHPLNPDEVVGIVFPERNLAIWQGRPGELDQQNIDEPVKGTVKETLTAWYNQRSLLKRFYTESMDFKQADNLREQILNRILCELTDIEEGNA